MGARRSILESSGDQGTQLFQKMQVFCNAGKGQKKAPIFIGA